jgi:hypothetical protein
MLYIPSWYTGRAFKAVDEGGQDPNWQFKMMRFPYFEGGQGNDLMRVGYESGYHVLTGTGNEAVAKDILAFAGQPKYGALWTAVTNVPSAILYDIETDWPTEEEVGPMVEALGAKPGQWDWYWAEFARAYGDLESVQLPPGSRCAEFKEAYETQVGTEGLTVGLMTLDEAIEALNGAQCEE